MAMRAVTGIMPVMGPTTLNSENCDAGQQPLGDSRSGTYRRVLTIALVALVTACVSVPRGTPDLAAPLASFDVTSKFGRRSMTRPHYGIDLRAAHGAPVMASAPGRVVFAGKQRGFGNIVIVDHGRGTETYYAHLSSFAVGNGARVGRGEVIGFVGQTGNASAPHLHFEVRMGGRPRDPLLVLNERPAS